MALHCAAARFFWRTTLRATSFHFCAKLWHLGVSLARLASFAREHRFTEGFEIPKYAASILFACVADAWFVGLTKSTSVPPKKLSLLLVHYRGAFWFP